MEEEVQDLSLSILRKLYPKYKKPDLLHEEQGTKENN